MQDFWATLDTAPCLFNKDLNIKYQLLMIQSISVKGVKEKETY